MAASHHHQGAYCTGSSADAKLQYCISLLPCLPTTNGGRNVSLCTDYGGVLTAENVQGLRKRSWAGRRHPQDSCGRQKWGRPAGTEAATDGRFDDPPSKVFCSLLLGFTHGRTPPCQCHAMDVHGGSTLGERKRTVCVPVVCHRARACARGQRAHPP